MRKVDEYRKAAESNSRKSAREFVVGDFIITATACGKDTSFADFIDARENWQMGSIARLCKIVDIVDVDESEDFLNGWLSKDAPSHSGGSQSDDIDESRPMCSLTTSDYETFFDLITVYRKPSDKWIGVDCQGYDYWRYVHMPVNYDDLFADERTAAIFEMARAKAEQEKLKNEVLAEHLKAFEDRENELKIKYRSLRMDPSNGSQVSGNIRKFLSIEFPKDKFKVTARKTYWGDEYDVEISIIGVVDAEKIESVRNICKVWTDTMPIGRMYDCNDGNGSFEPRRCPMSMFGNVRGHIYITSNPE